MEKYKNEKGGISIYVLVSMFLLTIILMGIYISVTNKHIAQLEIAGQIKSTYEQDVNNVDAIYNELIGEGNSELTQEELINLINASVDTKLINYETTIESKIASNAVGFPDYTNRTVLTIGQEYTADENMYIIIDFTDKTSTYSYPVITIDGISYYWHQGYINVDYGHSLTNIIPIKKGSIFKVDGEGRFNVYKVPMVYSSN